MQVRGECFSLGWLGTQESPSENPNLSLSLSLSPPLPLSLDESPTAQHLIFNGPLTHAQLWAKGVPNMGTKPLKLQGNFGALRGIFEALRGRF